MTKGQPKDGVDNGNGGRQTLDGDGGSNSRRVLRSATRANRADQAGEEKESKVERPAKRTKRQAPRKRALSSKPTRDAARAKHTKTSDLSVVSPGRSGAKSETEGDGKIDESTKGQKTTQYWLMKAEPDSRLEKGIDVAFSIDHLRDAKEPEGWDGVRNYTARNNLKQMKVGDLAFFYHSNCKTPGIVGIMEIVREASVDHSAFDPANPYYDQSSNPDQPKWFLVHVAFRRKFHQLLSLTELKSLGGKGSVLENMAVLRQSRLSVSGVTAKEWEFIVKHIDEQEAQDEQPGKPA